MELAITGNTSKFRLLIICTGILLVESIETCPCTANTMHQQTANNKLLHFSIAANVLVPPKPNSLSKTNFKH